MPPKNVQVAVLVRPFTNREKEEDCSCIVEAKDGRIEVYNRELDKSKEFNFDLSVRYVDFPQFLLEILILKTNSLNVLQSFVCRFFTDLY